MSAPEVAAAHAEADHWKRKFEASEQNLADLQVEHDAKAKRILQLNRLATDRAYMMQAYRDMLGPKGLEVVQAWERDGVQRFHIAWGPAASELTGEERAQCILDIEKAPKREIAVGELDACLGPSVELDPKKAAAAPTTPDDRTHADGGGE